MSEVVELMRIALAEIDPSIRVVDPHPDAVRAGATCKTWGGSDEDIRRARLLVHLQMSGPEHRVTCPACHQPNDFERWASCPKVTVQAALRGEVCS